MARRNLAVGIVAIATMLGGLACPPAEPDGGQIISDFIRASGLSFDSCGRVETDHCGMWVPTAADDGAQACFLDNQLDCTPAVLDVVIPTIEGDPIIYTYLVMPDGIGGCDVTMFVDTTFDSYGPGVVDRHECPSADLSIDCGWVDGTACSLVETHY